MVKSFSRIAAALLLCAAMLSAAAQDVSLTELMSLLSQRQSSRATFVEKKFFKLLDKPVESSGELEYIAPDRVKKQTLTPKPELMLLEGDKLTLENAKKRRRTVDLNDHPEVATFVTSIRATLSGDRAALENYYTVSVSGPLEQWQLLLVPRQEQLLKVIKQIRISGAQARVARIEFEQADGDRSEMIIADDNGQ